MTDLRAKVEITVGWVVCDVHGDSELPATPPDVPREINVVDSCEDHVDTLEIGRGELRIAVHDLRRRQVPLREGMEAVGGADKPDEGPSGENEINAPRGDLAATDDEDGFVFELPSDEEGAGGSHRAGQAGLD